MNSLISQRRTLRLVERDLAHSDPQMARQFSRFTNLTRGQELPAREMLRTGPLRALARRMQAGSRGTFSSACRTWLAPGLVLMLMAVVCSLAAAGIGGQTVLECGPGFPPHAMQRAAAWCTESSWPV
jgi:hypothetical protein